HPGLGEVAHPFLQHLLLVVRGDVEEAARLAGRLARRSRQLLRSLERAAGRRGGAEAVLGPVEQRPLDLLADADAVEQVRPGEPAQPAKTEAHAALRHPSLLGCGAHLYFLPSLARDSSGTTCPSRSGVPPLAARTAQSICS